MSAAADSQPEATSKESRRSRSSWLELPILIVIAFGLALLLRTFVVAAFFIPSESMVPTLEIGDRVLVNKVVYDLRDPRRGEVVVFTSDAGLPLADPPSLGERIIDFLSFGLSAAGSEEDYIKRVIGLPGEEIEMRDGVIYIDGEPLPEELVTDGGYLQDRDLDDFGPETVPEGTYFMMGDWRTNSGDSRFQLGPIPEEDIVGRAFVVVWPPSRISLLSGADY